MIRGSDFTRTLRQGSCAADGTLVLFALPTPGAGIKPDVGIARLGVTIPKKMGSAVVRNRWKRLIRESFRTQQDQIPSGYDYVVRPKKGAQPDWIEIRSSIPRLAQKAVAKSGREKKGQKR